MGHHKNWIFLVCLLWTITKGATSNHSSLLDNITREFGARLKKLDSALHTRTKSILTQNVNKYMNRASHNSRDVPIQKDNSELQKNCTGGKCVISPLFRSQKNITRKPQQHLWYKPQNVSKNTELRFWNNRLNANRTNIDNDKGDQSLIRSQNLNFNKIEPFWPFSNLTANYLDHSFKSPGQDHTFPFSSLPDRFKDTTFFFSHVGPNRFEYRAQFHHDHEKFHQPKQFKPFVHEFPEFPKITFPPFPTYPEAPPIFHPQPNYPSFPEFPFPTLPPAIKRNLGTPPEPKLPENNDENNNNNNNNNNRFGGPFNHYDIVLGDISTKYPKIFRFNEERINIEDFEKQKKRKAKLNSLNHNLVQPENVQRNHLLILHGGIFTVKEPPLYHRKIIRKRRQRTRNPNRIGNI